MASTLLLGDTGSTRIVLEDVFTAPASSVSALCSMDFVPPTGDSFDARLDQVRMTQSEGIFADGFESGDRRLGRGVTP